MKILVAYDSGRQAVKALEIAIEVARRKGASIHLVTAYHWSPQDGEKYSTKEDIYTNIQRIQSQAVEKVRQSKVMVYTDIREGPPGPVVCHVAEHLEPDLIAMGTHNCSDRNHLLIGSASNYVLNNTASPVLVVKG